MSNYKCYKCDGEMVEKKTTLKAGWGKYKLTINGLDGFVCENCGETFYRPEEVEMIQEIGRGYADSNYSSIPEVLNVAETADILRLTIQTIYNMIKDGRLKAYKCGREWRFNKKDILSLINPDLVGLAARSIGNEITEEDKKLIQEELNKM